MGKTNAIYCSHDWGMVFSAHDGDNTGPPEISPAELFKSSVRVKAESMVYGGYNELVNGC